MSSLCVESAKMKTIFNNNSKEFLITKRSPQGYIFYHSQNMKKTSEAVKQ